MVDSTRRRLYCFQPLASCSNQAAPAACPPAARPADVADVAALQPTAAGLARLGGIYYAFLARPSPVVGELCSWGWGCLGVL